MHCISYGACEHKTCSELCCKKIGFALTFHQILVFEDKSFSVLDKKYDMTN